MPTKKPPPIRTVAEELANRQGDARGLLGVTVRIGRSGYKHRVEGTAWDTQGRLQVTLGYAGTFPSHLLYLSSVWPVVGHEPTRRHRWNTPRAARKKPARGLAW
jgi:hypothetical protein